jgi:hypothetical protein
MIRGNADGVTSSNRILFTQQFWKSSRLKKNINKARLSSQLSHINSKGRITTSLSQDWFKNCFVLEAEKYCWGNNIPFKILLIIDNATAHLNGFHSNVLYVFLPAHISPPAYWPRVTANFTPYPANVENMASSYNASKWQIGFNSALKGLKPIPYK